MQDSAVRHWVLRILNGPLQGAEFVLKERRTLVLVGPQGVFCDPEHTPSIPADALYIPLESGACNFEILIDDARVDGLTLRLLGDSGNPQRACLIQAVEQVGDLRFALRSVDQPWQQALLHGMEPLATGPSVQPRRKQYFISGSVALGLVIMAMAAGAWWVSRPGLVSQAQTLIQGSSARLPVFSGRDRQVYVFADSERDLGWSRQALERSGQPGTAHVLSRAGEEARLGKRLAQAEPALAWHRIDLSDPARPLLLVSDQRNLLTPALEQRITQTLYDAAPYAIGVGVEKADDELIVQQAEDGLNRLALPFRRGIHKDTVTFTLRGDLADAQIEAARGYVRDFNSRWGSRFVHFAIELKEDERGNKSFQYGPEGYVKTTPTSWHFPEPD